MNIAGIEIKRNPKTNRLAKSELTNEELETIYNHLLPQFDDDTLEIGEISEVFEFAEKFKDYDKNQGSTDTMLGWRESMRGQKPYKY